MFLVEAIETVAGYTHLRSLFQGVKLFKTFLMLLVSVTVFFVTNRMRLEEAPFASSKSLPAQTWALFVFGHKQCARLRWCVV